MRPALVTSYYAAYRSEWGVPVRSSVGHPRWWRGPKLEHVRRITPYGVFGHTDDPAEYERLYVARLERAGVDALAARFADLSARYGGKPLVVMCFEKRREDCHRRLFAEVWERWTGESVPEVKEPAQNSNMGLLGSFEADQLALGEENR